MKSVLIMSVLILLTMDCGAAAASQPIALPSEWETVEECVEEVKAAMSTSQLELRKLRMSLFQPNFVVKKACERHFILNQMSPETQSVLLLMWNDRSIRGMP